MSKNGKEKVTKVVFTDDVAALTFDRMRDELAAALTDSQRVELELGNIKYLDGSLVELMCSAHRVADSLDKTFTFGSAKTAFRIRELASDSGYTRFPCKYRTSRCLYREGAIAPEATDEE